MKKHFLVVASLLIEMKFFEGKIFSILNLPDVFFQPGTTTFVHLLVRVLVS